MRHKGLRLLDESRIPWLFAGMSVAIFTQPGERQQNILLHIPFSLERATSVARRWERFAALFLHGQHGNGAKNSIRLDASMTQLLRVSTEEFLC